jgi:hypothetical protein
MIGLLSFLAGAASLSLFQGQANVFYSFTLVKSIKNDIYYEGKPLKIQF